MTGAVVCVYWCLAVVGRSAWCCGKCWRTKSRTGTSTPRQLSGVLAATVCICRCRRQGPKASNCSWGSAGLYVCTCHAFRVRFQSVFIFKHFHNTMIKIYENQTMYNTSSSPPPLSPKSNRIHCQRIFFQKYHILPNFCYHFLSNDWLYRRGNNNFFTLKCYFHV